MLTMSTATMGYVFNLEDIEPTKSQDPFFKYLKTLTDFKEFYYPLSTLDPNMIYTFHETPSWGIPEEDWQTDAGDQHYDLDFLSFLDKEKLKSVGSIDEIAQITGLSLLPEQNYASDFEGEANYRSRLRLYSSSREHRKKHPNDVILAKRGLCEPEKVSVPLVAEVGFRVIPACMQIKKCGGCCNPGRECVATITKQLKVKALELSLANNFMQWRVLENVSEDEECECRCRVKEKHCLPTQDYDPDACSCLCKPNLERVRQECEMSNRLWDSSLCQCQCPLRRPNSDADCGTGQTFNSLTCSCEN